MKIMLIVALFTAFLSCVAYIVSQWREDRRRIVQSRRIANQMIDEYEARDSSRIGQFKRFKL